MPSEQWYRNQGLTQIQAQREAAADAVRAQIERERQMQMRQQQAQAQTQAQASQGYVQRPPREPHGARYPERSGGTAYHQVNPGYGTSRGQTTNGQVWQQQRQQQQQQQAQDRGNQGHQYHHTSGQQRHGDQGEYYGRRGFHDGVWPGYNADFE
jgi:hypothetical protein